LQKAEQAKGVKNISNPTDIRKTGIRKGKNLEKGICTGAKRRLSGANVFYTFCLREACKKSKED